MDYKAGGPAKKKFILPKVKLLPIDKSKELSDSTIEAKLKEAAASTKGVNGAEKGSERLCCKKL